MCFFPSPIPSEDLQVDLAALPKKKPTSNKPNAAKVDAKDSVKVPPIKVDSKVSKDRQSRSGAKKEKPAKVPSKVSKVDEPLASCLKNVDPGSDAKSGIKSSFENQSSVASTMPCSENKSKFGEGVSKLCSETPSKLSTEESITIGTAANPLYSTVTEKFESKFTSTITSKDDTSQTKSNVLSQQQQGLSKDFSGNKADTSMVELTKNSKKNQSANSKVSLVKKGKKQPVLPPKGQEKGSERTKDSMISLKEVREEDSDSVINEISFKTAYVSSKIPESEVKVEMALPKGKPRSTEPKPKIDLKELNEKRTSKTRVRKLQTVEPASRAESEMKDKKVSKARLSKPQSVDIGSKAEANETKEKKTSKNQSSKPQSADPEAKSESNESKGKKVSKTRLSKPQSADIATKANEIKEKKVSKIRLSKPQSAEPVPKVVPEQDKQTMKIQKMNLQSTEPVTKPSEPKAIKTCVVMKQQPEIKSDTSEHREKKVSKTRLVKRVVTDLGSKSDSCKYKLSLLTKGRSIPKSASFEAPESFLTANKQTSEFTVQESNNNSQVTEKADSKPESVITPNNSESPKSSASGVPASKVEPVTKSGVPESKIEPTTSGEPNKVNSMPPASSEVKSTTDSKIEPKTSDEPNKVNSKPPVSSEVKSNTGSGIEEGKIPSSSAEKGKGIDSVNSGLDVGAQTRSNEDFQSALEIKLSQDEAGQVQSEKIK